MIFINPVRRILVNSLWIGTLKWVCKHEVQIKLIQQKKKNVNVQYHTFSCSYHILAILCGLYTELDEIGWLPTKFSGWASAIILVVQSDFHFMKKFSTKWKAVIISSNILWNCKQLQKYNNRQKSKFHTIVLFSTSRSTRQT